MAFFAEDVHLLARYSFFILFTHLLLSEHAHLSFSAVQVLMAGFLYGRSMKVLMTKISHKFLAKLLLPFRLSDKKNQYIHVSAGILTNK